MSTHHNGSAFYGLYDVQEDGHDFYDFKCVCF